MITFIIIFTTVIITDIINFVIITIIIIAILNFESLLSLLFILNYFCYYFMKLYLYLFKLLLPSYLITITSIFYFHWGTTTKIKHFTFICHPGAFFSARFSYKFSLVAKVCNSCVNVLTNSLIHFLCVFQISKNKIYFLKDFPLTYLINLNFYKLNKLDMPKQNFNWAKIVKGLWRSQPYFPEKISKHGQSWFY